jgi:PadR family transcriptional regulator, regulatory protein PadR
MRADYRQRGVRSRRRVGRLWAVRARVERFAEPWLLLLLRERPKHGYELLEELRHLIHDGRGVDLGNLYRVLRALEEDGFVRSDWNAELPGPAKRVYELTDAGRELLVTWADALGRVRGEIDDFLRRHDTKEGR